MTICVAKCQSGKYRLDDMAQATTRPDLNALLAHAQAALRVKDWEIEIGYVPDLEMGGGPVWGTCAFNGDMRKAWIAIRDPLTPPPGVTPEEAFAEVAKTVIHETAHLLFVPFANSTPSAILAEEQAVWAFSDVLEQVLIPQMTDAIATQLVARLAWAGAPAPKHARAVKPPPAPAPVARKVAPPVAREGKNKMSMSYETMGKLIKALGLDPTATEDTIKKALGMSEDGASEEPAAEPMAAKDAPPDPAAPPAKDPEAEAAKARIIAITGKPSVGEAARTVETWKKDSAELADLKARTTANQAALDASERKALVARLVTECGEHPATAWKDPLATELEPGPAWAGVDLDTLRARVATLSKAPKARTTPPAGEHAELSKRELEMCAEMKIDPKDYAARKVARKAS